MERNDGVLNGHIDPGWTMKRIAIKSRSKVEIWNIIYEDSKGRVMRFEQWNGEESLFMYESVYTYLNDKAELRWRDYENPRLVNTVFLKLDENGLAIEGGEPVQDDGVPDNGEFIKMGELFPVVNAEDERIETGKDENGVPVTIKKMLSMGKVVKEEHYSIDENKIIWEGVYIYAEDCVVIRYHTPEDEYLVDMGYELDEDGKIIPGP